LFSIEIQPVTSEGEALLLICFVREMVQESAKGQRANRGESPATITLEQELEATRAELQGAVRALEISSDDQRAINEEALSVQEEFQSTNEELLTSKEELQSLNEELSTVNQQLQSKVLELETAYADLKNLLASSEIATICLDRDFRIRWFTPAMTSLFNLIDSDLGRPISDFAAALSGGALLDDAAAVLQKLAPVQRQLELDNRHWYLRRAVPYRGDGDAIDGVVVTFTDITEARRSAESLVKAQRKATESLEQKVRERTAQLRALAGELSLAEERERRSLAQDLHDDLGQVLAIVKHKLTALHGRGRSAGTAAELKTIEALIDQANKSMRTLAFQLSPPVLHTLGLIPALEWLAEEIERVYGLKVSLNDDGAAKPLDEAARTALFRAVRELLINVAKHAKAGAAEVTSLRASDQLTLAVSDDGSGFDYERAIAVAPGASGLGLMSVRERVEFIGGEMHVDSSPGAGTTVTIVAPLQTPAEEEER
jgi:two-component system CheB/CheR fusion protein